jgi:hypothetical protein
MNRAYLEWPYCVTCLVKGYPYVATSGAVADLTSCFFPGIRPHSIPCTRNIKRNGGEDRRPDTRCQGGSRDVRVYSL